MSKLENVLRNKAMLLEKFKSRGKSERIGKDRLPPGQHVVTRFPVLDLGIHPEFDRDRWRFSVDGSVENPIDLSWGEFTALPKVEQVSDFHCVTAWSQYDVRWGGVAFATILDRVRPAPSATHVIQECNDGYTTNLPLAELTGTDVLLAYELEGAPLPIEHGGPLRLIVPHLYGWKSAKFLARLRFQDHDTPGFWEVRGYHDVGDPWEEERYR